MIRQILRGCGSLPYVGSHPGTFWLGAFTVMGFIAGSWRGSGLVLLCLGPLYLYGAYERAIFSDLLSARASTQEGR
jgi:hypothetical protein